MGEIKGKYKRCCILLSGGIGSRMESDIPKQYVDVSGKTILEHTLLAISNWNSMDSLMIVAEEKWQNQIYTAIENALPMKQIAVEDAMFTKKIAVEDAMSIKSVAFLGFAKPGLNRQFSVINALHSIKPYMKKDAVVMIHDSVRPCVSAELLERCDAVLLEQCDSVLKSWDGIMPYLPMKDTVYISTVEEQYERPDQNHQEFLTGEQTSDASIRHRTITSNIDRDTVVAGQTPEFYNYWKYLAANESLSEGELRKIHGSTEAAVAAGMKMVLVPGDEGNFKITTREDLERFRRIKQGETDASMGLT